MRLDQVRGGREESRRMKGGEGIEEGEEDRSRKSDLCNTQGIHFEFLF